MLKDVFKKLKEEEELFEKVQALLGGHRCSLE
jgi:hypothetical protein